jgi:phenylacetic acid degradation operon negative regulatory protein
MIAVINPRITTPEASSELRPLSPRSIVLSVLLGSHPPSMPVGRLLAFTSLFGITDGTARTALSRMVTNGELVNVEGTYRLGGRLLERQAQQDAGRAGPTGDWDGTWWLAAVTTDRRSVAARRDFRSRVIGARFGELRPDTWLRPANIDVPLDLPDVVLTRGPMLTGDAAALVASLWPLDELDREARRHAERLAAVSELLATDDRDLALVDSFVSLAGAQRFLRTEPQLPESLSLGPAAAELRTRYGAVVGGFQRRLAEFLGAAVSTGAT